MRFKYAMIVAVLLEWTGIAAAQDAVEPTLPPEVAKGKYLATAGNCISCHTVEGGKPFAGGVSFVTPFGKLYSTNISQDVNTGIGKWTLEDFKTSMRKGVRPDGTHLYPAFPYTAFTKLTDADLAALYAYIKTIPAVPTAAKPNEMKFPFNVRAGLAVWKLLFLKQGPAAPQAGQSAEWNRGAYLVEGLGHCGACHTPRNFAGAERADMAFTGGVYTDKIATGAYRTWSAVNLTSAPSGLGAWSVDDLAEYLKTGAGHRATVFGPMNEVVMNSTRHLSADDVRAMAVYLKSVPAKAQEPGAAADTTTLALGLNVYTARCGTCHMPTGLGSDGDGVEKLGVPLAGSAVVQATDPSSLINTILHSPRIPPPPFDSSRWTMEAFGVRLKDADIAAVASYLRSAWGNTGGAVTAEQVAKQR